MVTMKAKLHDCLINPFNAELHPFCHLLALLGARLIFHVSRIRVKHLNTKDKRREDVQLHVFLISALGAQKIYALISSRKKITRTEKMYLSSATNLTLISR